MGLYTHVITHRRGRLIGEMQKSKHEMDIALVGEMKECGLDALPEDVSELAGNPLYDDLIQIIRLWCHCKFFENACETWPVEKTMETYQHLRTEALPKLREAPEKP